MSKRTNAVKLMLTDDELADATRQAVAMDLPLSEVIRRGWLASIWGSMGLALRRAKRNRGSDEELSGHDFMPTGFGDGPGAY